MPRLCLAPGRLLAAFCSFVLWLGLASGLAQAAGNDGRIEADGVWHDAWDVAPRAPQRGEAFRLEVRTFRFDCTSVAVRLWDGGAARTLPLRWDRADGSVYDIWAVDVPAIDANFVHYRFELRDGPAFATFARSGYWGGDAPYGDFLLNLTALGRFPLGATVDGEDTVFRVWCPDVAAAEVILDPQGASPRYVPMTQVRGHWQVRIPGVGHAQPYQFRFQRNGQWLVRNDPRARWVTGTRGVSLVQRSAYPWGDTGWRIPDRAELILSEVHVGTYSGRGDGPYRHPATFRDLADRHIDHLVESGINVLNLMPINEFPGELSWGYNPVFAFAPESTYGTPEDLKYLVDRCHRAGIAVFLDVVLNHFGGGDLDGNLLNFNGDEIYFYPEGHGLRESGYGPRPDFGRVEVRDFLVDSLRHFIEEYHIDGFRLDHTALIKVNRDGWELLREISRMRDRVNPRVVLTVEQWPNDAAVTRPVIWGGAGQDAQWSDIFHDNGREVLNQLAYGDPSMDRVADAINHFGYDATQMINFVESHDEARFSPPFASEGRIVRVADQINPHSDYGLGRGRLFFGFITFAAGIPLYLQGQEFAVDIGFGDAPQHKIPWEYKTLYAPYFAACRDMMWLKRRSPALRADANQFVHHRNDGANVITWERERDGHRLMVVANFGNLDYDGYWIGLPEGGTWHEVINTNHAAYGGRGDRQNGTITAFNGPSGGLPFSVALRLPRYSLLVLAKQTYDLRPDPDADNDALDDTWERTHGLDPNNPDDGRTDRDGDGWNEVAEFLFGLRPAVYDAGPRIEIGRSGDLLRLGHDTVPGRSYQLQWSTDLVTWHDLGVPFSTKGAAGPGRREYLDLPPVGSRSYRLVVRLDR